jgi:hypothetical protein
MAEARSRAEIMELSLDGRLAPCFMFRAGKFIQGTWARSRDEQNLARRQVEQLKILPTRPGSHGIDLAMPVEEGELRC